MPEDFLVLDHMALHIDEYYLRSISFRFESFLEKGNHVFNVRCPICGDSSKSKSKARGYFYKAKKGSRLNYMCHNCGASMSFANFLKEYEPDVYAEYAMEIFGRDKVGRKGSTVSKEAFQSSVEKDKRFSIPAETQRISNLPKEHPAHKYLLSRLIPSEHFAHIFYTENFAKFVAQYDTEKEVSNTPRIIIPFYDREYNLMGFQGRAMPWNFSEIRYITIKLSETFPKIYGLHRLRKDRSVVYVTEGPLDSLFLPNGIAMMGADLDHSKILSLTQKKEVVYIFDNEPRSAEIQRRMKQRIDNGRLIVIWPDYVKEKDINQMIMNGYTKNQIQNIITENTVSGMKAKLLFGEWRK